MTTYAMEWKCRSCGTRFTAVATWNEQAYNPFIDASLSGDYRRFTQHTCDETHRGLADLIGVYEIEEKP